MVDRVYDLLVIGAPNANGTLLAAGQLTDAQGQTLACTGILKLAQRWLKEFNTVPGSVVYAPTRGCDFTTQLGNGNVNTELDVFQAFSLSGLNIRRSLQSEETDDMPDDERLAGADLVQLFIAPGSLALQVKVRSVAGDAAVLLLPVSTI